MAYGRYFEEFTVGEVIRHWPGRTISEADCTWFALLTMNQHPLHSDAHYAATHTQHGQRVVLGPLVFSIGIGMTVADVSGKAIANLEIEKIVHEAPTFIGDTIYSESTVLATRESSKGDRGTVSGGQRFVIDFDGEGLRARPADQPPNGIVSAGPGQDAADLLDQHVVKNPATGGWRLSFQLKPKSSAPVELRAFLTANGDVLTETWSYVLLP